MKPHAPSLVPCPWFPRKLLLFETSFLRDLEQLKKKAQIQLNTESHLSDQRAVRAGDKWARARLSCSSVLRGHLNSVTRQGHTP